jgi:signal transduction histidine kinase
VAVYRIAQEALNNVWKHSAATSVAVSLRRHGAEVMLRIADDGRGFDLEAQRAGRPETSFGLLGMAERAELIGGRLAVDGAAGMGTAVELWLPVAEDSTP